MHPASNISKSFLKRFHIFLSSFKLTCHTDHTTLPPGRVTSHSKEPLWHPTTFCLMASPARQSQNQCVKSCSLRWYVGVVAWKNLHFGIQNWNFQEIISVIRNTFRPKAQKTDSRKSAYLINYSLKWLISLSREPFVLWSCSTPHFNQKTHFSLVILNYKSFQVNQKCLNWLF